MKYKLLSLFAGLLVSQSVLAQTPPKPEACPGFSALRSATFTDAKQSYYGFWYAWTTGAFATADNWTFLVSTRFATNKEEAIAEAHANLSALTAIHGMIQDGNEWKCAYSNADQTIMGLTVTPQDNNFPLSFKSRLR